MVAPYALDFSPITNALADARQYNLQSEQQDWKRQMQPLLFKELQSKINDQDQLFPFQLRQAKTAAESGEETLNATRALRNDMGIAAGANPAASRATAGAEPHPLSPVGDFVQQHILSDNDPNAGKLKWDAFRNDPRFKADIESRGYGTGDDWRGNATRMVQDIRRLTGGPSTAAPTGAPPAPAPAAPSGDQAMQNLARMWQMAQRKIASGVPAFVQAGEQEMKTIQTMMEKGYQITNSGGVMPIPGAAESSARTEGMKKEAENQQANYNKASEAGADASALATRARDLRQLAPNSILGSGAEYELAARKIASRLGYVDPRIKSTELLKSGLTQFISSEAQKLKPVSASDIAFVERSVGGLSSDPSSLPHILAAWETAAQRQKLYHDLEAQSYTQDIPELGIRKGYPNRAAILSYVDKKIPSYVESMMGKEAQNGPATADGVKNKTDLGRLQSPVQTGSTQAAPADGALPTTEQLLKGPDGPVLGGKFIKRGTQLFPVEGPLGSQGNPYANLTDVQQAGDHAFDKGKLYRRNKNLFANRWDEVQ